MKPLWPSHYAPPGRRCPSVDLVEMAAREFLTTTDVLRSDARNKRLTHARAIAANALRQRSLSYEKIGRMLGGRDHSTIIHACAMLPYYLARYPELGPVNDRVLMAARRVA